MFVGKCFSTTTPLAGYPLCSGPASTRLSRLQHGRPSLQHNDDVRSWECSQQESSYRVGLLTAINQNNMHTTPLDRCTRTTPATQSPDLSCCVLALSAWPCSLESRECFCSSCCVALNSCQAGCRRVFMFACVRLCTFINLCVCVCSTKMFYLGLRHSMVRRLAACAECNNSSPAKKFDVRCIAGTFASR